MTRLFVAAELPAEVRARLAGLGGGVPGAKWVPPENLHLTLRFIGEVAVPEVADIMAALAQVRGAPMDVTLAEVGHYGPAARARVLWVGVERNPALVQLRDRIESSLVRAGIEPEQRKFSPHITLARLKRAPARRIRDFVEARNLFRAGPFRVDRFVLFSSLLGGENSVHRVEADYPLAG